MERLKWSDERLDRQMAAIDDRFDRVLEELRTQRDEMRTGFAEIRGELKGFRGEFEGLRNEVGGLRNEVGGLRNEVGGLRTEVVNLRRDVHADHVALQRHVLSLVGGMAIAVIGLLGAFVLAQV